MTALREIVAVTSMNLRNVPGRLGNSAVIVVGMACVVAVVVSGAALSVGLNQIIQRTGHGDRAIVLSKSAGGEGGSGLPRASEATILGAPHILRSPAGAPLASAEVMSFTNLPKRSNGSENFASIRGIGRNGLQLRPEIKVTHGRTFVPGVRELIAGKTAVSTFTGLEVGDEIKLQGGTIWKVVGTFASDGDAHESELLGDAETLLSAMRRNGWSSVVVQLESAERLPEFTSFLTTNPAISVDVKRESDFYAESVKGINNFLWLVIASVGTILGLGALAGALNTMYATVRARNVEIATLRAIGFSPTPVVASVLLESMLLAGLGAAIGGAIAWVAFDGTSHTSRFIYTSAVTPGLLLTAIGGALAVGLLGGLLPAVRAARLPVAVAFRAK